ncbi:hypothetical protein ACFLUU_01465 [Chloroflexota bacterium]
MEKEEYNQDISLVLCVLQLLETLEKTSGSVRLHQILEQTKDFQRQLDEYLTDKMTG